MIEAEHVLLGVLREGDTVLVPPRGRTVKLDGAVRREARFELTAAETIEDLLRYGGDRHLYEVRPASFHIHLVCRDCGRVHPSSATGCECG